MKDTLFAKCLLTGLCVLWPNTTTPLVSMCISMVIKRARYDVTVL